jgi:hypothetical protein
MEINGKKMATHVGTRLRSGRWLSTHWPSQRNASDDVSDQCGTAAINEPTVRAAQVPNGRQPPGEPPGEHISQWQASRATGVKLMQHWRAPTARMPDEALEAAATADVGIWVGQRPKDDSPLRAIHKQVGTSRVCCNPNNRPTDDRPEGATVAKVGQIKARRDGSIIDELAMLTVIDTLALDDQQPEKNQRQTFLS